VVQSICDHFSPRSLPLSWLCRHCGPSRCQSVEQFYRGVGRCLGVRATIVRGNAKRHAPVTLNRRLNLVINGAVRFRCRRNSDLVGTLDWREVPLVNSEADLRQADADRLKKPFRIDSRWIGLDGGGWNVSLEMSHKLRSARATTAAIAVAVRNRLAARNRRTVSRSAGRATWNTRWGAILMDDVGAAHRRRRTIDIRLAGNASGHDQKRHEER